MKYDYDLICIGLGPAGLAVSVMGSEMGLKVCSIEKNKVGGECMNVGCIPSKALLKTSYIMDLHKQLEKYGLKSSSTPEIVDVFTGINESIEFINEKKNSNMLKKTEVVHGEAYFVDAHTVNVNGNKISAKKIFIASGTIPMVPPIPGIDSIEYYTNMNIFQIKEIPKSMTILGGGAIGCELAQAFNRLGTQCSIVHMDDHLLPITDMETGKILEEYFNKEGIEVHNSKKITGIRKKNGNIIISTEDGLDLESEKLLVAAGRKHDVEAMKLENAGVKYDKRGIKVNKFLQTSKKNIFAVGDCNGNYLLTHAAMHQGMIAIMNAMIPTPFKINFKKFTVPWTMFTDPQISQTGMSVKDIRSKKKNMQVIEAKYSDYGAAIAEHDDKGFIRAYVSPLGRIYGVVIMGRGSGEMINEWSLAIQKKIKLLDIMMLQHSFPTMGFLTKRISEIWMMKKMQSGFIRKMIRVMF